MMSYAFSLLLLGTFAVANGDKTPVPNYLKSQVDINDALDILDDLILSIEEHYPLLNDTRRQYAEIVHVMYNIAVDQSGCLHKSYEESYQSQISTLISEALINPQAVVDEVRKQKEAFLQRTPVIRLLIRDECFPLGYGSYNSNSHWCDERVQRKVDLPFFPKGQARILLAAGKAANSFLARHEEFLATAKAQTATRYIIHGAGSLKEAIMDFADYLRAFRENPYGRPNIC